MCQGEGPRLPMAQPNNAGRMKRERRQVSQAGRRLWAPRRRSGDRFRVVVLGLLRSFFIFFSCMHIPFVKKKKKKPETPNNIY